MAQGSTITADATERLLAQLILNLGGASGPSGGLGELLTLIVNQVPLYNNASPNQVLLGPANGVAWPRA